MREKVLVSYCVGVHVLQGDPRYDPVDVDVGVPSGIGTIKNAEAGPVPKYKSRLLAATPTYGFSGAHLTTGIRYSPISVTFQSLITIFGRRAALLVATYPYSG